MSNRSLEYLIPVNKIQNSELLTYLFAEGFLQEVNGMYKFNMPISSLESISDLPDSQIVEILDWIFFDQERPKSVDLEQYYQVVEFFDIPKLKEQLTQEFVDNFHEGKLTKIHGYYYPMMGLENIALTMEQLLEYIVRIENHEKIVPLFHLNVSLKELCVLKNIEDPETGPAFLKRYGVDSKLLFKTLGLVKKITINGQPTNPNLDDISTLAMFPGIESLTLVQVSPSDLQVVSQLKNLREFSFVNARLYDLLVINQEYFLVLENLTELRKVQLIAKRVRPSVVLPESLDSQMSSIRANVTNVLMRNLHFIKFLDKLSYLEIDMGPELVYLSQLTYEQFREVVAMIPKSLTTLKLSFGMLRPINIAYLLDVTLPNLRELFIENYSEPFIDHEEEPFQFSLYEGWDYPIFPRLKKLEIKMKSSLSIGDFLTMFPALESLKIHTRNLQFLDLSALTTSLDYNKILAPTIKTLELKLGKTNAYVSKLLENLPQLTNLSLYYDNRDPDSNFFWMYDFNTLLVESLDSVLQLSTNTIFDDKLYKKFPNLQKLQILSLYNGLNTVNEVDLKLDNLKSCKDLTYLSIGDKMITRYDYDPVPIILDLSGLSELPSLEVLKLEEDVFISSAPDPDYNKFTREHKLRKVEFNTSSINCVVVANILRQLKDAKIKKLYVNIMIHNIDDLEYLLESISEFTDLEGLRLSLNYRVDILYNLSCQFLEDLQELQELNLDINGPEKSKVVLINTKIVNSLPKLEILNISSQNSETIEIKNHGCLRELEITQGRGFMKPESIPGYNPALQACILENVPELRTCILDSSNYKIELRGSFPYLRYLQLNKNLSDTLTTEHLHSFSLESVLPSIESVKLNFVFDEKTPTSLSDIFDKISNVRYLYLNIGIVGQREVNFDKLATLNRLNHLSIEVAKYYYQFSYLNPEVKSLRIQNRSNIIDAYVQNTIDSIYLHLPPNLVIFEDRTKNYIKTGNITKLLYMKFLERCYFDGADANYLQKAIDNGNFPCPPQIIRLS